MNPDFDPAVHDVDFILDEMRDSGELPKAAPSLSCLHCGQPIVQVPAGAFKAWRHLDGRMFCAAGAHIATPDYGRKR